MRTAIELLASNQLATAARGRHHEPVAPVSDTVTLWRPTDPKELALVEASGWREWPPRLPGQPIFYPVLNEEYAAKIARDWSGHPEMAGPSGNPGGSGLHNRSPLPPTGRDARPGIAPPPAGSAPTGPGSVRPSRARSQLLAWRGLLEIQAAMLPTLEAEMQRQTGLTLSEFDVLYQLWRVPDKKHRMGGLARAVLVTAGGLTRIVRRLEARDLVRRTSAAGRQAVLTQLTPRGDLTLQAAMDVHFGGVRRLFIPHLDDADLDRIIRLRDRMKDGASSARPAGQGRHDRLAGLGSAWPA